MKILLKMVKTGSNYQYISSEVDIIEPAGSDTFVVTKLGNKEVTARFHSETDVQIGSKSNSLLI